MSSVEKWFWYLIQTVPESRVWNENGYTMIKIGAFTYNASCYSMEEGMQGAIEWYFRGLGALEEQKKHE